MKKCDVNTILYTKDGRKIGNAIVIEKLGVDEFVVKTDYGNIVTFNLKGLHEFFYMDFLVFFGVNWDLYENYQSEHPHKYLVKK